MTVRSWFEAVTKQVEAWRNRTSLLRLAERRDTLVELLAIAELRATSGRTLGGHLQLRVGETLIFCIPTVGLTESRQISQDTTSTSWDLGIGKTLPVGFRSARTQTVSLPGSSSVVIDSGVFAVTTQRILFLGSQQTREVPLEDLIGFLHDSRSPTTYLQVRHRDVATGVRYDGSQRAHVDMALKTATSLQGDSRTRLVEQLRNDLADLGGALDAQSKVIPLASTSLDATPMTRPKSVGRIGPASRWSRLMARVIDAGVLFVPLMVLVPMAAAIDGPRPDGTMGPAENAVMAIWLAVAVLYEPVVSSFLGTTLGKRSMNLVVIEALTGQPAGPVRLLMRSVLRAIAWVTFIGLVRDFARLLRGLSGEPWHDRHAETAVVSST